MIIGAGILFKTKDDNKVLFLKRGPTGDHPGEWCFPGGKKEENETAEQTATRETKEEIGSLPDGTRSMLCRSLLPAQLAPEPAPVPPSDAVGGAEAVALPSVSAPSSPVDFTTFVQTVPAEFEVTLDHEHVGYAWAPANDPPQPLHPGCGIALDMLTCDELGIARYMSRGEIASPYRYKNVSLFAIRITGTGVSYRRKLDEFVFRNPELYLNDEFLARCNGLPVIFEHPEKAVLNSSEFADRIIGTILLPYIKGDEVWGIAKIYDDSAIALMSDPEKPLSTSPSVVLSDYDKDNPKFKMEDGSVILIEGKPSLLDHIAICERGVWDKGGDPTGVIINDSEKGTDMTEEEKKALADSIKGIADSVGKLCSRMDSMEEKEEAKRVAADKAKKDAEEEEKKKADAEAKAKMDAEEEEKKKKDSEEQAKKKEEEEAKAKKDAEEKEKADAEAKAKADSEIAKRIADVEKRLPVEITDADYKALTDVQAMADSVFHAFGDSAPRPLNGESVLAYRKRLAGMLKQHSQDWKGVDLIAIGDSAAFDIAEKRIYADASAAALNPTDIPEGQMRAITSTDRFTGHRTTRFVGKRSFVRDFSSPHRRATAIRVRRDQDVG